MQAGHTKGRQNQHKDLNSPQKYLLTNKLTNKQVRLLFNLKCQSVSGIKDNFHRQYPGDLLCPLCKLEVDSQIHILTCLVLKENTTINPEVKYEFIHNVKITCFPGYIGLDFQDKFAQISRPNWP